MRKQVAAAAIAAALALPVGAQAQSTAPSKGQMMEAVVTVISIDPSARTVRVQTPKGETTVSPSPDIQLDQIQVGARYRVRYSEPVAVEITPGAQPSAAAGATAKVKPGSGAASGQGVKMDEVAGVVDTIDSAHIVVRTLEGGKQAFKLGASASAGSIKPGDAVTVTYQQAIATHMVSTPQPIRDPAPAQ